MKHTLITIVFATLCATLCAQTFTAKTGKQWAKKGTWQNGFTLAKPYKATDYKEFAEQYHKNQATWDSVFHWLATHNLDSLPAGKYPIIGATYARIQVATTRPDEQCQIESHRKYVDFQFTIRGKERLGMFTKAQIFPMMPYDAKRDVRRYELRDQAKPKYTITTPKTFFMFFPNDYHQAMLRPKKQPTQIRKVIVKIEYKE